MFMIFNIISLYNQILYLEMVMFKHFPIMLSTSILRIIHVTPSLENDVFLLSCTILPYSLF